VHSEKFSTRNLTDFSRVVDEIQVQKPSMIGKPRVTGPLPRTTAIPNFAAIRSVLWTRLG
jgi:hypothetical protein